LGERVAFDLKKYKREWMRARRNSFLAGQACKNCGSTEKLEIDHIVPSQKTSHNIWSWKKERREEELKKCQILCHSCHVEKSLTDGTRPERKHGTSGYRRGCRCDVCRTEKVKQVNEYRWKTGRRIKRVPG